MTRIFDLSNGMHDSDLVSYLRKGLCLENSATPLIRVTIDPNHTNMVVRSLSLEEKKDQWVLSVLKDLPPEIVFVTKNLTVICYYDFGQHHRTGHYTAPSYSEFDYPVGQAIAWSRAIDNPIPPYVLP